MKSDHSIRQQQNEARQRAQRGNAVPGSTPQSAALVAVGTNGVPVVKRRWLVGDPWTANYYFADWKAATE